jgi:hypothetical protein
MTPSMMILIAGPYRSGTGDDPAKMAANLAALEAAAFPIFQKGHVPMIGEWAALPILRGAGGGAPGSAAYDSIMHPTAHRLLHSGMAGPFRNSGGKRSILNGIGGDSDAPCIAPPPRALIYHSLSPPTNSPNSASAPKPGSTSGVNLAGFWHVSRCLTSR